MDREKMLKQATHLGLTYEQLVKRKRHLLAQNIELHRERLKQLEKELDALNRERNKAKLYDQALGFTAG